MRRSYQLLSPPSMIGVVVLVSLLSFIIVFFLSAVLAIPFWGADSFLSLMDGKIEFSAENVGLLKFFQLAQSIGLFVIPPFVVAYLFSNHLTGYLQINRLPVWKSVLLALLITAALSPVINLVGAFNAKLILPQWLSGVEQWMRKAEDDAKAITELFLLAENGWGLMVNLFIIALIPALGEEFLFRGVIQKIFFNWTKNGHWAIWISAILFSALHMQFYGFLPRVFLGALFGYFLWWSGNLWLSIIAHFFNNAIAVIAYYYYDKGVLSVDPELIGTETSLWPMAIISLVVVYFLSKKLIAVEQKNQKDSSV